MLVHNNHWQITRNGSDYFAIPPRTIGHAQTPIPMTSRNKALVR
jgi:hypothetical protein